MKAKVLKEFKALMEIKGEAKKLDLLTIEDIESFVTLANFLKYKHPAEDIYYKDVEEEYAGASWVNQFPLDGKAYKVARRSNGELEFGVFKNLKNEMELFGIKSVQNYILHNWRRVMPVLSQVEKMPYDETVESLLREFVVCSQSWKTVSNTRSISSYGDYVDILAYSKDREDFGIFTFTENFAESSGLIHNAHLLEFIPGQNELMLDGVNVRKLGRTGVVKMEFDYTEI